MGQAALVVHLAAAQRSSLASGHGMPSSNHAQIGAVRTAKAVPAATLGTDLILSMRVRTAVAFAAFPLLQSIKHHGHAQSTVEC